MTTRTARATAARKAADRRRQAVLHRVTAGALAIGDLLTDPSTGDERAALAPVSVSRLLRALPGVGEATVVRVCRRAQIDRGARVGDLDVGRRRRLADAACRLRPSGYAGRGPIREQVVEDE